MGIYLSKYNKRVRDLFKIRNTISRVNQPQYLKRTNNISACVYFSIFFPLSSSFFLPARKYNTVRPLMRLGALFSRHRPFSADCLRYSHYFRIGQHDPTRCARTHHRQRHRRDVGVRYIKYPSRLRVKKFSFVPYNRALK